jgi:hypothetical protein
MSRKLLVALGVIVLLLALASSAALAAGPGDPPAPVVSHNPLLGIVPTRGQAAARLRIASGNLVYHNGPVMHTNTAYAIYWIPAGYSVSTNYVSLINGFFQNVAADNGKTSNVYYSDTQYYDNTSGNILYNSTFGGFVIDTNPYPANGCTDSYTSVCLSDAQLQVEIQRVMQAQGWTGGTSHLFFMFTPKNVGSCAGSSCAFTQYCAYHSWIGSGSSVILYANQPYASFVAAACDSGQHPNGDDADATINVVSHEHNEAITDQQGSAWYDRRGYENGDKCAWNFGTPLGGTNGSYYNQVINNAHYYLQQEWSNKSSKCVLTGQ